MQARTSYKMRKLRNVRSSPNLTRCSHPTSSICICNDQNKDPIRHVYTRIINSMHSTMIVHEVLKVPDFYYILRRKLNVVLLIDAGME